MRKVMLKSFTKRGLFTFAKNLVYLKSDLPRPFPIKMSDTKLFKKNRYDGRSKKRQWEERRTDKSESFNKESKKIKINNESDDPNITAAEKIKRRKYCLLMGYSGSDYYGMQRNPSTKTIEEDLFQALYKTGFINDECLNQVQNMQFQRAARTDKAARQIVSLKLPENIDLAKINAELPEVIRVFAYKRVTKGFNSKTLCDGRTYIYLLPTVSFAEQNQEISQKDYRMSDETLNKVNEVLQNFVGTKNFHNYTSKKKPNDPSANRYIKSFICEKPFVRNDVEFAVLKVHGQSFMMHQIRKMVGCLLAVLKGLASIDMLNDSFKMEKIAIPRVPGLGLMLDYVHYDRYNNRYGEDGMHQKLTWEEVENQINEFKEKYIYPTIINTEIKDEEMVKWIENKLSRHSYDFEEEEESDNEGGDDDDDKSIDGANKELCSHNNVQKVKNVT
ncbi:hypothetical protein NQ317_007035 [Molorchus minor]|uniref:Pseudouridine synthase I TruA alpha/beta domain-containing protein n=1 Tax=Molorchus minor TaxID=1323400 RepID=A0ABQ9J0Z3_9CUCU|nr:hypothetical protein NQ317_007035 [Molorchus minor]